MTFILRRCVSATFRRSYAAFNSPVNNIKPERQFGVLCQICQNELTSVESSLIYITQNNYSSKSKKGKGQDKGQPNLSIEELTAISEGALRYETLLSELKELIVNTLSRSAQSSSLSNIKIKTAKEEVPLQYLGQISARSRKMATVNMVANPQYLNTAMQTINKSGLNLSARIDGSSLIVESLPVTKEHREEMKKMAKREVDDCKKRMREECSHVKKLVNNERKFYSQSELHKLSESAQQTLDVHVKECDVVLQKLTKEILGS